MRALIEICLLNQSILHKRCWRGVIGGVFLPNCLVKPIDIADKGFLPIPDSSDGQASYHCLIYFELPVQELQVNRFIACFDEPEANPAKGIS